MLFGNYFKGKDLFFSSLLFFGTGLGVLIGTKYGIYLCKKTNVDSKLLTNIKKIN